MSVRAPQPHARATRHEAIVHPARRRRRAVFLAAVVMDVLAAAGLQSESGAHGYLVVLLVMIGNLWLCCSGSDRTVVVVGDDGIVSGGVFCPFWMIESVVTPFRRPGHIRVRLKNGRQLAYSAPADGHLLGLRTRLLQELAAYRREAAAPPLPVPFDALAAAPCAAYRRPSLDSALWTLLESPAASPASRARAALELAKCAERSAADLFRLHAVAVATAHPALRRVLLASAGHEPLSGRSARRLLRGLAA